MDEGEVCPDPGSRLGSAGFISDMPARTVIAGQGTCPPGGFQPPAAAHVRHLCPARNVPAPRSSPPLRVYAREFGDGLISVRRFFFRIRQAYSSKRCDGALGLIVSGDPRDSPDLWWATISNGRGTAIARKRPGPLVRVGQPTVKIDRLRVDGVAVLE
jgi:hypothetical protein